MFPLENRLDISTSFNTNNLSDVKFWKTLSKRYNNFSNKA